MQSLLEILQKTIGTLEKDKTELKRELEDFKAREKELEANKLSPISIPKDANRGEVRRLIKAEYDQKVLDLRKSHKETQEKEQSRHLKELNDSKDKGGSGKRPDENLCPRSIEQKGAGQMAKAGQREQCAQSKFEHSHRFPHRIIRIATIMHRSPVPILLFCPRGMHRGRRAAPVPTECPAERRGVGIAAVTGDSGDRMLFPDG